jgi:hypothetical protein
MESKKSTSWYVWRVVRFLYAGSRRLSSYTLVILLVLTLDIHLYSSPSLSPIASPSMPSESALPPHYNTYSYTKFPIPTLFSFIIHDSRRLLKVIRYTLYCCYPFNPFASSSFHPLAYAGCWWDLRRDPSFPYLHIILVLGVFQGLCGVWIISTSGTMPTHRLKQAKGF